MVSIFMNLGQLLNFLNLLNSLFKNLKMILIFVNIKTLNFMTEVNLYIFKAEINF